MLNGHVFCVDVITNASGIVILCGQVLCIPVYLFAAIVMVVKAHDIAVRCNQACMLLILPAKVVRIIDKSSPSGLSNFTTFLNLLSAGTSSKSNILGVVKE